MKNSQPSSLKRENSAAIWALAFVDACLVAVVFGLVDFKHFGTTDAAVFGLLRAAGAAAIGPIAAVFLNDVISSDLKEIFVFWRIRHVLPGHRAFSVFSKSDSRIDIKKLKARIGEFPKGPKEQNAEWYRLLRSHEQEISVADAHRRFLLFRDCTALTLILGLIACVASILLGHGIETLGILLAGTVVQFAWLALSARSVGFRLVRNVLAIESHTTGAPERKRK